MRSLCVLRWNLVLIAALAAILVALPLSARAQIGLDPCCAIISAGLKSISSLLKGVVATPLSSIQQIQQEVANFERQVVYPPNAITSAKNMAAQIDEQLKQVAQLYRLPTNSATLPSSQQLERSLLSHNPLSVAQVSAGYFDVYGAGVPPADAPTAIRELMDMNDAEAQAALKKAVELDALADVEIAAADRISEQIRTSAPGSAPILESEAAAWVVRGNAYTQSAMAELIRIRSIDLANASAEIKLSAAGANALRNSTGQALQRRGSR